MIQINLKRVFITGSGRGMLTGTTSDFGGTMMRTTQTMNRWNDVCRCCVGTWTARLQVTVACHDLKNIDNTTHFHIYNAGGVFFWVSSHFRPFFLCSNEFGTWPKRPWPLWHFSDARSSMMHDCWIDQNGTVPRAQTMMYVIWAHLHHFLVLSSLFSITKSWHRML